MSVTCLLTRKASMNRNKKIAKKRMMYIHKEDYNFLSYNLLLVLYVFECFDESSRFRDFRKIAYLIDFISSQSNVSMYEKNELVGIYSKAQLKKKLLSHLLIVLKNRNYVDISLNNTHGTLDVWLKIDELPSDFFDKEIFQNEIANIKQLKRMVRGLKRATAKRVVDNIFTKNGVMTWEV